MTTSFKISQVESRIREKEKLMKELLPLKTPKEKSLFKKYMQEIKKLSSQAALIRKSQNTKVHM